MAASIKPIDDNSINLLQSGQVIVDLCSVVKELIENSVDSGANNIDVRFKNQGLDRIEVQDNGSGIPPADHALIALKHHTSKLSCYSDISSLRTFGFRGEALASLCALSQLTITTCIESDVPKGCRLSFDTLGKLSSTTLLAAQRGTTVSVENLFHKLPVRRRELERNIKREWHKVIALLNQYACIQTNLKFSVSQQPSKGKRVLLFSTNGNQTTRENIINIFGSKAVSSLVPLDILLEMESSRAKPTMQGSHLLHQPSKQVRIKGFVSRPIHGEGRHTPDRQMFFVNGRPCGLPQLAKTFNEVYKSYNHSQSPFIFADIQLDTNMYDVNVSPDKRSVLLHDQTSLLDHLRTSIGMLFDRHDHRLPAALIMRRQPSGHHSSLSSTSVMTATEAISPNYEEHASVTDHVTSDVDVKSRLPPRSWGKGVQNSSRVTAKQDDCTVGDGHSSGSKWPNHDVEWARLSVNGVEDMNKAGVETRQKRAMSDESGGNCANSNGTTCHVSGAEPISSEASTRQDGRRGLNSTKELLRKSSCTDSDVETSHEDVVSSPPSKRVSTISSAKTSRTRVDVEVCLGKNSTIKITPPVIGSALGPTDDGHISKYKVLNGLTTSVTPQSSAEGSGIKRRPIQSQRSGLCDREKQRIDTISNARISRMDEARDKDDRKFSSRSTITKASTTNEAKKSSFANAQILQVIYATDDELARLSHSWGQDYARNFAGDSGPCLTEFGASDAESKLSLMISKNDFAKMRVVGQFNLGFIIALRPRSTSIFQMANDSQDELLIIDQHASDEKFNFEKLQANTVVQSQRLVHPKTLVLTALEEEIVLQNVRALEANGFQVQVDVTGTAPVGSRCRLLALPLSRESTFTVKDLEDLISLLADEPVGSNYIPRPSAVRKMLAMRACRSSIMIGKALTTSQMSTIIRHMGELDKPWNCPHGRPTMRHLCRIQALREAQWTADTLGAVTTKSWATYISYTGSGR